MISRVVHFKGKIVRKQRACNLGPATPSNHQPYRACWRPDPWKSAWPCRLAHLSTHSWVLATRPPTNC